ncbi:MAG: DUF86 domain-containing protein, partial [Anaerolineales bacterium]
MNKGINTEMVRARLSEILENVEKIRDLVALSDEDIFADERNLYTLYHLLLICIEAVATICNHLLARLAKAAPASYSECFERLRDLGILEDDMVARLIPMARFRNFLVHRYWDIDPDQVLIYARNNLGDFEDYSGAII